MLEGAHELNKQDDERKFFTKEIGRRFSKRKIKYVDIVNKPEGPEIYAKTTRPIRTLIKDKAGLAAKYLESVSLPSESWILYDTSSLKPISEGDVYDEGCWCDLDHYVIDILKFEIDSLEGLAARMICHARKALEEFNDDALDAAFNLGETAALFQVYTELDFQHRKGKKRKPRKNKNILLLIQYLKSEHPEVKDSQLFTLLPKSKRVVSFENNTIEYFQTDSPIRGHVVVNNLPADKFSNRTFRNYVKYVREYYSE